ncbi:unnamed protein product [Aphanomyces euteiches]|uniref:Leishmanolysin-like peptidase n=1 Tax=Aphanomyces euteiches TaxID=100861 RepID=A0A6G0X7N7_9STRA|nr:hypothetical protein Ae201684_007580 [Aphanomyces euteiches]KAH9067041.1 hypothetical protein Ae201684P_021213 [Aphanomyces euteiches]KAH9132681.1 hypothetical protein AeRB84_021007 [Aphanomyces euteiches]
MRRQTHAIVWIASCCVLPLDAACIQSSLEFENAVIAPQSYANHNHGEPWNASRQLTTPVAPPRALQASNAYQKLRITPIYDEDSLNALSEANATLIKSKLIADAIQFWSNTLSVVPIDGPWFAQRKCIQVWQTTPPVCNAVESNPVCFEAPIPENHFAPLQVCSTCPRTGCYGGDCTTTGDSGVPNTDYVLYVRAVESPNCAGNVLAYATSCQQDQFDRPTMGMVNFCPSRLNPDPRMYTAQLTTATHEITHALGFTSKMFPFMRFPDGTPRTPRDASGQPPILRPYTCPNGLSVAAVQLPSNSTVQFFTERGHSVAKLVTPAVLEFVRNYFNCSTLNGAEIEDQDGACLGSHWEERIFEPELMSPLQSYHNPLSGLTLSYFQDSGWYKVDTSQAQPMQWGANRGCSFATNSCIQTASDGQLESLASDHFCVDSFVDGCSMDLTARASCTIRQYSRALPLYDQYFGQSNIGGAMFPDFCPILEASTLGDCSIKSNLEVPQGTTINLLGETYSDTSVCVKSTLLTKDNDGWSSPGRSSGCYAASCSSGLVTITVVGSTDTVRVTCSHKDQVLTVPGFTGTLLCPDPNVVCGPKQCSPFCPAPLVTTSQPTTTNPPQTTTSSPPSYNPSPPPSSPTTDAPTTSSSSYTTSVPPSTAVPTTQPTSSTPSTSTASPSTSNPSASDPTTSASTIYNSTPSPTPSPTTNPPTTTPLSSSTSTERPSTTSGPPTAPPTTTSAPTTTKPPETSMVPSVTATKYAPTSTILNTTSPSTSTVQPMTPSMTTDSSTPQPTPTPTPAATTKTPTTIKPATTSPVRRDPSNCRRIGSLDSLFVLAIVGVVLM